MGATRCSWLLRMEKKRFRIFASLQKKRKKEIHFFGPRTMKQKRDALGVWALAFNHSWLDVVVRGLAQLLLCNGTLEWDCWPQRRGVPSVSLELPLHWWRHPAPGTRPSSGPGTSCVWQIEQFAVWRGERERALGINVPDVLCIGKLSTSKSFALMRDRGWCHVLTQAKNLFLWSLNDLCVVMVMW